MSLVSVSTDTSIVPRLGLVAAAVLTACIERPIVESVPPLTFAAVTTGQRHACGLTDEGDVYCWSPAAPRPAAVSNGIVFASISTYWDHTCGVAVGGAGYCWGDDAIGQLGADTARIDLCRVANSITLIPCSRDPALVNGGLTFASIAVGAAHSCGLTTDGEIWCWGANGSGQLGTDSTEICDPAYLAPGSLCSFVPVRVDGTQRYAAVTAGLAHTCAVDDADEAWCWGEGDSGRLGSGAQDDARAPSLVRGGLRFRAVDAGGSHTCGVATDGQAFCWGSNSDFQAGSGDTDVRCGIQLFRCLLTPHPVSGNLRFAAISVSDGVPLGGSGPPIGGHSCGLTEDRRVFCWGLNTSGQLVNHNDLRSPTPIGVTDEYRFTEISAGKENTCGITTGREMLCWAFGGPVSRYYVFN